MEIVKTLTSTSCLKTTIRRCYATQSARLLLGLLLMLTLPAGAQAQFDYDFSNGALSIVGYRGPGRAVTIPDPINGLTVTGKLDQMCHYRLPTRKPKTSGATPKKV